MIPLRLNLRTPGAGGIVGANPILLPAPIDSYAHTITARGGFESCHVDMTVDAETAIEWLNNGLMRSVVVYGPDAEIVWEGYLDQVDATFGQETRSVSLREMTNRVRCVYTTVLGTPGTTATASDTDSQARYGIKDGVVALATTTATGAAQLRDRALRERKNPRMTPGTTVATGALGDVKLTLIFAGWYHALAWLVTANTSTTTTSTTAQVTTLTTAYNTVNNFFSDTALDVTASGIADTEYIETNTTYLDKIEALLEQGNSAGERLAWGVYEGRQWKIDAWAGASPATIDYQRYLGDGQVYSKAWGVVAPWNVRPDAMYQVADLLDAGPVASAQDAAARFYVERVTCRVGRDGWGVDLEPADTASVDAQIARIG